mmetsp:Transcript_20021/g.43540  ORF Transcript_20021/g.43540 Transcript_20021/m.43540 type:complete len:498 (-) Transcript_20021:111-1604(-)
MATARASFALAASSSSSADAAAKSAAATGAGARVESEAVALADQHGQEVKDDDEEHGEEQEKEKKEVQAKEGEEKTQPLPTLPLEGLRRNVEAALATVVSNDRPADDSGSNHTSAAGSRVDIYSLSELKHMAHGRPLDLSKAFVINFRRLLELQKIFAILHELIRSTAIAALTLVAAGDGWQMGYSIMFVIILFGLYGFHAARYDTMDTTDFLHIAAILDDDDCFGASGCIKNPNRLLKAVALSRRGRRKRASLTILIFAAICLTMWYLCLGSWAGSFSGTTSAAFGEDEFYPTLLLVGTLMLGFCVIFDWFYWRETQCIMSAVGAAGSSTAAGTPAPFDPQKHGIPRSHRLLGLPAMWFTSKEAYDDLRLWISMSQQYHSRQAWRPSTSSRQSLGSKIFPEELAIFALNRQGGGQLANALRNAKLFGVEDQAFFTRDCDENGAYLRQLESNEEPESLNMRLVFFDSHTGQYYEPEEVPFEGFAHHLSRLASRMSRN